MSQSSVTPVGAREVPSSNPFGEALLQAVNLMIERKIEQESARMRWATVTSVKSGGFNPTELRIRYDQETKSSPVTPIDLDGNLSVGDRVRVIWFKGQATILPRKKPSQIDTGWQPIPSVSFNPNFESYSGSQVPMMKRSGNWVTLRGAFRCITANHIVGTEQKTMASLSNMYRPETDSRLLYVNGIMQGSGSNQWYMGVHEDGRITASRYTATSHNNNLWLPFHIVYEGKPVS